MDERYRMLFEPLRIGPVTTKNRFYAVPHATWSLAAVSDGETQFACAFTGEPAGERAFASLLLVGARQPANALYAGLAQGAADNVRCADDCEVSGTIQAAVHSGHRVARELSGDALAGATFRREQARIFDSG